MKNTLYIILALITISCANNQKGKDNFNSTTKVIETKKEQQPKKKLNIQLPLIAAFGDSIQIYDKPNDSSEVIGLLKRFESLPHFDIYLNKKHEKLKYNSWFTKWIGVKYNEDTCWVKSKDSISFEVDIERFNQLVIQHRFHYVEIEGEGYCGTQVIDTTRNLKLFNSWMYRKYCYPINDSLYLFNVGKGNIIIYNTLQDSITYNEIGMVPVLNKEFNQLFFLKWQEGSIEKYGYDDRNEIPCELIMYNYRTNVDTVIYKTDSIERKPYNWGPDYRYDTELKIKKGVENNIVLEFELYRMKPDPIHEGDYVKSIVKVDTLGNEI